MITAKVPIKFLYSLSVLEESSADLLLQHWLTEMFVVKILLEPKREVCRNWDNGSSKSDRSMIEIRINSKIMKQKKLIRE